MQLWLQKLGVGVVEDRVEAFLVEVETIVLIVEQGVLPYIVLIVNFAWLLPPLLPSLHHLLLLNFDHF